jgi:hypothetical protein
LSEIRRKTFHYKVAKFKNDGQLSLQAKLKDALGRLPKAMMRQQETMIDGEKGFRLVNQVKDMGLLYCGVLMSYKEGTHQNRIRLDLDADELSVDEVAPSPEDATERHEFVEGLLYFGVYKNHIIFVGSAHLSSYRFEKYLNWLLTKRTKVLARAEELYVADAVKPDYSIRPFSKLKEMKLKTYIATEEQERGQEQTDSASANVVVANQQITRPVGREWEAVKSFLESYGVQMPEVNFQGNLEEHDLELNFSLVMRGRRKGLANLRTPVIDTVPTRCDTFKTPQLS